MTNHNIKEYELIRQEMESLKDRLTKHMSFAIGSSGLLFLAIQTIDLKAQDNLIISMICIFTALIITAFFYLSIYKYNSLNRYAGYCKLINLEVRLFRMNVNSKSMEESKGPESFITWEFCMARLANSKAREDFNRSYFEDVLDFEVVRKEKREAVDMIEKNFYKYRFYEPNIDINGHKKGIKVLLKAFNKNDKSESWKYPLYSCYVYYILIFYFVAFGSLNLARYIQSIYRSQFVFPMFSLFEIGIWGILFLIIVIVVFNSFKDIFQLMIGTKTVNAYCWKFLPYRIAILNEFQIKPRYFFTEKERDEYLK